MTKPGKLSIVSSIVVARIRKFSEMFKQRHGSILCKDLLGGCIIGTPEVYKEATDRGLFVSVCRPVVEEVGEILEGMLDGKQEA